ncbi:SDR family NAD(P)-dependent oxidoreductase [Rhodobiaceae bacterium]|jgi:3-oxoacyl-[acyl-carrier protein] reductase|nr:SDR family NAD(P)-dependent oxidoreductase [Rhodobiaceae bacterium]
MDLGISGKTAIVNGGSAGMGKGSALALAREGVNLFISSRGEERLKDTCEEIRKETGVKVTAIATDHSTDEGREKIISSCPSPDILVGTCTPPMHTPNFETVSPDDWRKTLEVSLLSPVAFMKELIPGMVERKWGRIVNIGTGAAKTPAEVRILSGAPRAALVNYSVAVSKKVARHNVAINNILPGMHHTAATGETYQNLADKNGTSYDEEVKKFTEKWRIPARKFGTSDDFGAFVTMFCSQQATYVIGQSLVIDGGIDNTTF